ncbi:MAG: phytoene desaturase family protein [Acidimicrobiales bacterium]
MSTIVIGAGLAGLTTAALLADAGHRVTVIESRRRPGGRATTDERQGHLFNQGPHALYLRGRGLAVLRGLGIDPAGGVPPTTGALGLVDGRVVALPSGARTLVTSPAARPAAKLELARFLARLSSVDPTTLADRTTADWLAERLRRTDARAIAAGLTRVSTYCADLDELSADVGAAQLQLAFGGVRYLDGGWQQLVDALEARAVGAGAVLRTGVAATAIDGESGDFTVVTTTDDGREPLRAATVVVAASTPAVAARLTGSTAVAIAADRFGPITAACLDVGVDRLPRPERRFAYGLDRPLYYSVHSPPARLGTGVTLHAMAYLPSSSSSSDDERPTGAVRAELESMLDSIQPGWRERLTTARFHHRLTVANALPTPEGGGTAGRAAVAVTDRPGLFLAGDWVGTEGHLADTSLASAATAARSVLAAPIGARR